MYISHVLNPVAKVDRKCHSISVFVFKYKMSFCVFLFYMFILSTSSLNISDDCTPVAECEAARNRLFNDKTYVAAELINNALCENRQTDSNTVKVCCSMINKYDEIENHSNIKLLPDSCGDIDNNKLASGTTVLQYEMPWMVLITIRRITGLKFSCVGTLVNSRYVLTAAHCVKFRDIASVCVGEYDLARGNDCAVDHTNRTDCVFEDMRVSSVVSHNEYTLKKDNDIALIRLRRAANITTRNVAAVCLPITRKLRDYKVNSYNQAFTAGWGLTDNYQQSNVLLKDAVPVYYGDECQRFYNRSNLDVKNKFCAGKMGVKCIGDSGGPILIKNHENYPNKIVQYGIQAFGMNNCGDAAPDVYTDVTKYVKWILDTILP